LSIPIELRQLAEVAKDKGPAELSPRQLLAFYRYSRRGSWIVSQIRRDLKKLGFRTDPDFETVWVDVPIKLVPIVDAKAEPAAKPPVFEAAVPVATQGVVEVAPAHRISRLKAANIKPVSVKPTDKLETAVTLMMTHDFSQLPVMTSERDVKGVVSWRSMGNRLALKKKCELVKDCMEPHHEVRNTVSMFDVIRMLTERDCVLVRDTTNVISGIVTAADISEQFKVLSEPFLLLGDIENNVRRLIERYFTIEEIRAAKDPGDAGRKIEGASDLGWGEYVRLFENPQNWSKVQLALDRVIFTKNLNEVRAIRNDVMHFDPDGVEILHLEKLRQFCSFLDRTMQLLE
jgi:predicted transcriptional regulator